MPLSEELLTPIPSANPAGENLRYAPVYDKIKEARRQDDDAPQGEWRRERKLADWPATIKLITEALSRKSKDLQLAAWLTEALLRREGIGGLQQGLGLVRALLENFWENLYPEIEDGDAEMRATPLQWIADKLEVPLKEAPLTRSGLSWQRYKESRAVGYEADAAENDAKMAARQEAIAEGKSTAEDFDAAFDATPKAFYAQLLETCDAILSELEALAELCDAKFGDVAPGWGRLRGAVEEVRQTVYILLQKKREREPDAVAAEPEAEVEEAPPEPEAQAAWTGGGAAPAPARAPARKAPSGEPASREDAVDLAVAAARYIRREEPYSPVPYLMLRGLRWGELRANGASIDPALLEAPPGEIRQQLKRLAMESNWTEVLETAETAMALPCGRGWLDLQRYVGRACAELGEWYDPVAQAVKSSVRSLLQDFPDLPQMTLMDDTPSANAETVAWLRELAPARDYAPAMTPSIAPDTPSPGPDAPPDVAELALQAAAAGRPQEGIELLSREISRERSGRARFHRKVQLAQLCLSIGRETIAYPILNDLAQEIEQRRLDEWEAPDAVAHPLALLFRCLDKLQSNPEEKQRLYQRICRLDPVQAMSCSV